MSKPKCIKDYKKLGTELKQQIRIKYPYGFDRHLVTFKDSKGKFISALPFETDTIYYLIRMTRNQAHKIMTEESKSVAMEEIPEDASIDLVMEEFPEETSESASEATPEEIHEEMAEVDAGD